MVVGGWHHSGFLRQQNPGRAEMVVSTVLSRPSSEHFGEKKAKGRNAKGRNAHGRHARTYPVPGTGMIGCIHTRVG